MFFIARLSHELGACYIIRHGPTMPVSGIVLKTSVMRPSQPGVTIVSLFSSRIYFPCAIDNPLIIAGCKATGYVLD